MSEQPIATPPPAGSPAGPSAEPRQTITLEPAVRRPGSISRRGILRSALLVIGLPTLLAAIYYGVFASDQFVSKGSFIIKTSTGQSASFSPLSMLGFIGSGTSAASMPDMMVVNEYLLSPQIIADLSQRIDLRKVYATPEADWFSRLKPKPGSEEITDERLLNYWKRMAAIHFDVATGITKFDVRAFSAGEAQTLAQRVIELSEELVNRISKRAQNDALAFARSEVETYRERAIQALDEMQAFQERAQQVNPEAFAEARSKIEAGLETQLTTVQAQLDTMRKSLPEDAPGLALLRDRLSILQEQLTTERSKSVESGDGRSAADILNEFAKLKLEAEFASKAYLSALASLESARATAQRQSLFLEPFVSPQLPQTAEYPRRVTSVLLVFIASLLVWAIGGLFVSVAREHL